MNWLFRRHFWVVMVVFICIIAFILAKTATTVAGYWLSKSIPEKPRASLFKEPEPEFLEKNFSVVNDRNLFKAKREQISLDDDEQEVDSGRWQDAMPTTMPLKLVSTMVFSDPFDSRAVIMDMSSGVSSVYSLGECGEYQKTYDRSQIETVLPERSWEPSRPCNDIMGMATLRRIEEYRVYVFNERDRKWEYLLLLTDDKGPIHRPVMVDAKGDGEGVRKVGATSYEIERGEFDRALSNVARLMTEARAVPEMDASGNYIGFKLVYIKDGSLFEKIGIEKMDVLTRINGYELNSPEKALQLFGKLRTANQFTIDVKRGDRPVTLDYSVR